MLALPMQTTGEANTTPIADIQQQEKRESRKPTTPMFRPDQTGKQNNKNKENKMRQEQQLD